MFLHSKRKRGSRGTLLSAWKIKSRRHFDQLFYAKIQLIAPPPILTNCPSNNPAGGLLGGYFISNDWLDCGQPEPVAFPTNRQTYLFVVGSPLDTAIPTNLNKSNVDEVFEGIRFMQTVEPGCSTLSCTATERAAN